MQPVLHHIGVVVASIEEAAGQICQSFEADWDHTIIHDPLQCAKVAFFHNRCSGNPTIELVAPVGDDSPVSRFLKTGGGFHHLCYEVDGLDTQLERCRSRGELLAREAMPAVAFGGRRIAWVYTRQKLLIEYLEREFVAASPSPQSASSE
jgi:methylmalonyl-CoA/ethylmalonyl-CoA epimerase